MKDELRIIERCLTAAAPWIAAYAVHDTGSTDGTPDLVTSFFEDRGIPGRVSYGDFHDFAQARNDSLAQARVVAGERGADYLLLCDSDMELVVDDATVLARGLTADAYLVEQRSEALRYANLRLVRSELDARYVGVTHEYLDLGNRRRESLAGLWFRDHAEGSSRSVKFERDLTLLSGALDADPRDTRSLFYFAQTLRDQGRLSEAIDAYERRGALGGWEEEVWYSLFQVASLTERSGAAPDAVVAAYLKAFEYRPTRAETLVELSRYLRENGERYSLAHVFATRAVAVPRTADILFVSDDAYGWRAVDELAITSYWVGDHAASAALSRGLLDDPDLPAAQRDRVKQNLSFALANLE